MRAELKKNQTDIEIEDLGAGSRVMPSNKRSISSIAYNSLTSSRNSALLKSLIDYFKFEIIVELGTSLGINTAYLAHPSLVKKVFSFEGDKQLIGLAKQNLQELKLIKKVDLIHGNIDLALPDFIDSLNHEIDFGFIDANHTKQASLKYFELLKIKLSSNGIIVLDDINWNKEMREAWDFIRQDKLFTLSIETYQFGILFKRAELAKEHWLLTF
ncbi:MAG: class I SAM-dependent methyltransferase [Bacteroidota bacterium]